MASEVKKPTSRKPLLFFVLALLAFIFVDNPFRPIAEMFNAPQLFVITNGNINFTNTAVFVILAIASVWGAFSAGEAKTITQVVNEPDEKIVRYITTVAHDMTAADPNTTSESIFEAVKPQIPMMMLASKFDPKIAGTLAGPRKETASSIIQELKDRGAVGRVKIQKTADDGSVVDIDVNLEPQGEKGFNAYGPSGLPGRMFMEPLLVNAPGDISDDDAIKLRKFLEERDKKHGSKATSPQTTQS